MKKTKKVVKKVAKTKVKKVVKKSLRRGSGQAKKVKKVPSKIIIKKTEGKLVGKISHYFDNIKVGVISVSAPLGQGDQVRIVGGENTDFNQEITSMQVEHQEVKKAKKGDSVGFKARQKVREGYKVYKI